MLACNLIMDMLDDLNHLKYNAIIVGLSKFIDQLILTLC